MTTPPQARLVGIGIVGCNYGRLVQLPAFRHDPRCRIVALAGRDAARTAELARAANVPLAFGQWEQLVTHPDVDAVCIATEPELQPDIAVRALGLGKPVFAEKPMAADLAQARRMTHTAEASGCTTMVDFNFCAIPSWVRAKALLAQGAIGRLRHVQVNWNVENYSTRMRTKNWKSTGVAGGGVLGNFVSHCFHYLEWSCGPIVGLSATLSGLPGEPMTETNAGINMKFESGAAGHLAMSCASYLGSGHRIEFYGEDGTLVLVNETSDYMRGFRLALGQRPAQALNDISVTDDLDWQFPSDGRIAPVARLAARFLDGIVDGEPVAGGFGEGLRVQALLDAARRANDLGRWLAIEPEREDARS
ncbi:Gfo/Idh/MocA family oxidoreductase [Bradyrhizobium sp. SZCCHNS1054]|uniref:Gfo/Idh/MocA family protein n=1 Tax=Bradyrhizobium sp. SZCCHNS1054 TaxID=3057301 RepID=UPI002916F14A|nr:Gfo/Idh/MocA family oxidoreductase [Bradyrhizobium sp. SZCCHNS1054]